MTESEAENYYEAVSILARSGGTVHPGWFTEDDPERQCTVRRLQADARMRAALANRTL